MSRSNDKPDVPPAGLAASFDRLRQNLQNVIPNNANVASPASSETGSEGHNQVVRKARKSHQKVDTAKQVTSASAINAELIEKRPLDPPQSNETTLKKPKMEDSFASPQQIIANTNLSGGVSLDFETSSQGDDGLLIETGQVIEDIQEDSFIPPNGLIIPNNDSESVAGLQVPLCLCRVQTDVRLEENAPSICQAISEINGQSRSCANTLAAASVDVGRDLVRPHVRVPFFAVCHAHHTFLTRHICCPMCGVFCLKGSFLVCEEGRTGHYFHPECIGINNTCPHCGGTQFKTTQVDVFEEKGETCGTPPRFVQRAVMQLGMAVRKPSPVDVLDEDALDYTLKDGRKITSNLLGSSECQSQIKELLILAQNHALPPTSGWNVRRAIDENKLDVLLALLDKAVDPNERLDFKGDQWSPLHFAVHKENILAAYILLQAGSDPNLTTSVDGHTPLIMACDRGKPVFAHLLLKFDADPMVKCMYQETDGLTALHIAAMNGFVPVVHTLLKSRKVDLNMQDDGGWTALSWATEHGKAESVHLLLNWGARSLIKDMEGNVCLHWASYSGSLDIAKELLELDKGVTVALKEANVFGDTPLHVAAREKHWNIIDYFLTLKPDLSIGNSKGETAMQLIMDNAPDTTKLLARTLKNAQENEHRHLAERILSTDVSAGHERLPITVVNAVDRQPLPSDFHYVNTQVETASIQRINRSIESMTCCDCTDDCSSPSCTCVVSLNRFGVCVYGEDRTLNDGFDKTISDTIFECGQACKCSARKCRNRVAQKGISKRLQVYKDVGKGWCVRTLEQIKRGTFICEYTGEVLTAKEGDERPDDSYLFEMDNPTDLPDGEIAQSHVLDAKKYGNIARFINHGCDSNLISVKLFWDHQDKRFPHICLYADRDIFAHEELTFDYGEKFWIVKYTEFTCMCGAGSCKFSADKIDRFVREYHERHGITLHSSFGSEHGAHINGHID